MVEVPSSTTTVNILFITLLMKQCMTSFNIVVNHVFFS